MYHENWTMIGVTRCLEVASWPSFFPLAKSCRSRVCWVDMTSPLKQMAQFWSNYTPWIKLTVCTSKNWHLGRQSFFFCDTAYFQGRKLLVVWRLFGSIIIRGTKKLLQRHQGNSTFAQWCISCSWSGCDANWHHVLYHYFFGLGDDKSSLSHAASSNGEFPKTNQYTVN